MICSQEPDRSGAESLSVHRDLITRLKSVHRLNFVALDLRWSLWSNAILAAPAHAREEMINSHPPLALADLFARAPDHAASRMQSIAEDNGIALGQHHSHMTCLVELKSYAYDLKTQIIFSLDALINRLDSAMLLEEARGGIIAQYGASLRPRENNISRAIAGEITEQMDTDH